MLRIWSIICVFCCGSLLLQAQHTAKELKISFDKNNNTSATYTDIRKFYRDLDKMSSWVQVQDFGMTDIGQPLQEVVIASGKHFTPELSRKAGKSVLFINNGIHPGEPDGMDATMLFVRELIQNRQMQDVLKKVTLVIIPVYNIDGCLNRTGLSRPSQNGPELYGFRGNAQNLDLNRDFVKCDSKNAYSFNQLFNKWNPDVLVDTHASNGSDYQHTFTLISTHKERLHPVLSQFMTEAFIPHIYRDMSSKGWDLVPYVMSYGSPDKGIFGFMDSPRYSSGFASLHHTISFMPETHMLKPYKDRVASTLDFLKTMFYFMDDNTAELLKIRNTAINQTMNQDSFVLSYKLDRSRWDSIPFKGYQAGQKTSLVSGMSRLYYDRSKPWNGFIPYYNEYTADITVKKPFAYVVPQAYDKIIDLMKINGVQVTRIAKDTIIEVEMYTIDSYETTKSPYEGHYPHSKTMVSPKLYKNQYFAGDYIIYSQQQSVQYIVQTLEPQATDSWFTWNAFDGFLSQKEYYSDYVFEDIAAEMLEKNPELRVKLEAQKIKDTAFAADGRAQLDFIYKHSPYYEPEYMRYPVGRIIK
ncbi:MAG TPA: M14 family zinc carboxypeptidase [Saprospiraceae bacterium]|jgi:hypothetical protein|nr:hypothetical protein [Saprospiraceae bacterium]HRO09817.1 M14 family zinc carboxypeptidase [Saprospiraceae bacterium]HRP43012.1 M14 family zinc carboxypeptidase [Saprospiraceae bacterium]